MRKAPAVVTLALGTAVFVVGAAVQACGTSPTDTTFVDASGPGHDAAHSGDGDAPSGDDGGPGLFDSATDDAPHGCTGLQCQVHACASGSTKITGKVYDPAGKNPLYNVVVYVPNKTPDALTTGASCDSCNSLYTGAPITTALTDASGAFTLENVPDGDDIPLVIQVGKWRKQTKVSKVAQCAETAIPDKALTLPKNGSEGDIPSIAISTGSADSLECLLRRVGLDASEYGGGASGAGHIHIFQGTAISDPLAPPVPNTNPSAPKSSASLWDSKADLMKYDIVLLSCEGDETGSMNQQALADYTTAGGRVFASHFHYAWLNTGPFGSGNLATWTRGAQSLTNPDPTMGEIVTTLPAGSKFDKGQALHDWLAGTQALTNDKLPIAQARHNADVSNANTPSQTWIRADQNAQAPGATEYFSFNTPLDAKPDDAGVPQYCGRVVYSDLHVGAASKDYGGFSLKHVVPDGCTSQDLSPQEKALEFMLFDLSSCVTPDNTPQKPPPPVK